MNESTALHYKNRKGDLFYLQEGKTPTGNPRYYTGRKLTGTPLAALPDGYEFYERRETGRWFCARSGRRLSPKKREGWSKRSSAARPGGPTSW